MTVTREELGDPFTPDINLPHIRMRRNPVGGYMISSLGKIGGGDTLEAWQRAINATPDDKWFVANPRTVTIPRSRLESVAKRKYRRWMHEEKEKLSVIIRAIPRTDGLTSREVAKLIERSVRSARRFLKAAHARRQIAGSGSVQRWTGRYVF